MSLLTSGATLGRLKFRAATTELEMRNKGSIPSYYDVVTEVIAPLSYFPVTLSLTRGECVFGPFLCRSAGTCASSMRYPTYIYPRQCNKPTAMNVFLLLLLKTWPGMVSPGIGKRWRAWATRGIHSGNFTPCSQTATGSGSGPSGRQS